MIIQYYKIEHEKKSGNFNSHESHRTLLLVNLVNHVTVNDLSPIQNLPAVHSIQCCRNDINQYCMTFIHSSPFFEVNTNFHDSSCKKNMNK